MKRMLSLVLALTLVLGTVGTIGFAASYSDVDRSASYSSSVSLLSALKLLKGYEDGTFKPDGDITRAEFATVVVRALGQEDSATSAAGKTSFNDVPSDSWASGYINVASTLGIVNGFGDGNFGPEEKVTYEQSVKMMICALGYEALALSAVGDDSTKVWPAGYLSAANQLNIVTGVSGVEGVSAKRWQVARLVYNSLEIEKMEKVVIEGETKYVKRNDKTILKDNLNIEYSSGEFRANPNATVSEESSRARAGEVIIYDNNLEEEDTFKDGGMITDGMIGHTVKFYYIESNDGVKTLVYIEDKTKSSSVLNIDSSNLEKVTENDEGTLSGGATVYYWKDREKDTKASSAKIAENATFMVNGRIDYDVTANDLMPMSGSIELIDSANSGVFDKVLITIYEIYVVKSVNTSDKIIVDKYRSSNSNSLKVDEEDNSLTITIKRTEGTAITLSNISAWNVLSVKKSDAANKNTMDVIVSNKSISGTITAVDDEDTISINDKEYKVSPYYTKYAVESDNSLEFEVDDSGKFYLDKDDKVAAFDKTASAGSNYGFLAAAEYTSNNLKIAMLTQTGNGYSSLKGASKVKIDGVSVTDENVESELEAIVVRNSGKDEESEDATELSGINTDTDETDFGKYAPMLIKYSLNSSGEVSAIQTVENENLKLFNLEYNLVGNPEYHAMNYSSSNKQFTGKGNSKFTINSSTYVFVIPSDKTSLTEYSRSSYSYFTDTRDYCVEAYDVTGSTNIAKAVVVYAKTIDKTVNETSPIAFITGITSKTNTSDPNYTKQVTAYVYGKNLTGGSIVTLWAEENAIESFDVGDVIRYTTTSSGCIRSISIVDILDVHSDMEIIDDTQSLTPDSTPVYRVYNGLLYGASTDGNNQAIEVANTNDINKVETVESRESFTIDDSVAIFEYDGSAANATDKFKKLTDFDLEGLTQYYDTKDTENKAAAEVFIYECDDETTVVYIVKRKVN